MCNLYTIFWRLGTILYIDLSLNASVLGAVLTLEALNYKKSEKLEAMPILAMHAN